MMKRLLISCALVAGICASFGLPMSGMADAAKPDVVIVLCDDLKTAMNGGSFFKTSDFFMVRFHGPDKSLTLR